MWFSMIVGIGSVLILLFQHQNPSSKLLIAACTGIVVSLWIDKGIGLIIGGFVPSPMEDVVEYFPTFIEITVTLGIWAIGLLILTMLLKVAVDVKKAA
jgi:molybdopterin-containing oxidoreductase family membrane subunit